MMTIIRLWWHCLWKTVTTFKDLREDHRMCWSMEEPTYKQGWVKRRYCTCGYEP